MQPDPSDTVFSVVSPVISHRIQVLLDESAQTRGEFIDRMARLQHTVDTLQHNVVALSRMFQTLLEELKTKVVPLLHTRRPRMTKHPRSTGTKKPTYPSSVKHMKGRTAATENVTHPKNVKKQTAKARKAK